MPPIAIALTSNAVCRFTPASTCTDWCASFKRIKGSPAGVWRSASIAVISPVSVTVLRVTAIP